MDCRFTALIVALALIFTGSVAFGQDSLEPTGLKAGRVIMHPGVYVGGSWDSNLFYNDDDPATPEEPTDVFALAAGVSFRAETIEPENVDWWADARVNWEQYFSDLESATDQSGVESTVSTGFRFWPEGDFTMAPYVSYTRTNGPADDFAQRNLNHHVIAPGIDFQIKPNGGAIFSQDIGYDYDVRLYDDLEDINRHQHRLSSATRWNFLPQTGLSLALSQGFIRYFESEREPPGGIDPGFSLQNVDSNPFRAELGIKGLLFNRIDFTLLGGYGWTGYEAGENSHLFLGRVEVGYKWTDKDRLAVGYVRNFADSTFGNFYSYHRGYLTFSTRFANRFNASLTGRITAQEFTPVDNFADDRFDLVYDLDASLAYTFIPGFKATLSYLLRGNETDFGTVVNNRATSATYLKHVVTLALSYEY